MNCSFSAVLGYGTRSLVSQKVIDRQLALEILGVALLEFERELALVFIGSHLSEGALLPSLLVQNGKDASAHDTALLSLLLHRNCLGLFIRLCSNMRQHRQPNRLVFTQDLCLSPLLHLLFPLRIENYKFRDVWAEVSVYSTLVFLVWG